MQKTAPVDHAGGDGNTLIEQKHLLKKTGSSVTLPFVAPVLHSEEGE